MTDGKYTHEENEKQEYGRLTNETLRIGGDGLAFVIDVNFLSGEA
jgi:hypothetical protein